MNKIFFLSIICACALLPAAAQDRSTVGIQYQYALPMGSFKNDFINKGSGRGVAVDLMYAINPKWRAGGGFAYQDFYQKYPRATYKMEDGSDMSAVLGNNLQTTSLMAKGMFLPRGADSSRLQPYVSAGAGINMLQYSQMYGEFANLEDASFKPAVQAGVGVLYAVGAKRRTALSLGATYNYMPLNQLGVKAANNLAVQAGLRFTLRNDGGRGGSRYDDDNRYRRPNHYGGRNYGWY